MRNRISSYAFAERYQSPDISIFANLTSTTVGTRSRLEISTRKFGSRGNQAIRVRSSLRPCPPQSNHSLFPILPLSIRSNTRRDTFAEHDFPAAIMICLCVCQPLRSISVLTLSNPVPFRRRSTFGVSSRATLLFSRNPPH